MSNCTEFKSEVLLDNTTEFLLVRCTKDHIKGKTKDEKVKYVYQDMHAIVPKVPTAQLRRDDQDLSVMIIGIDSVSRLNLRRMMPQTLSFLEENDWTELHGYNKIADNTFPNLMAVLSGENITQIKSECYESKKQKMDDCPNIWKEFRLKGYTTAYAEDVPTIGTFNYMQTGFVEQPTDHYMRPFMLAAHYRLPLKTRDGLVVCIGPVASVDAVLSYATNFGETYRNHKYFGLFWINSLSHNNVNSPAALDNKIMKFLQKNTANGNINNTAIFLLSDHGMRFGKIRETFVGYLEERLPFIFTWLPKWFRHKHPMKYQNLLTNKHRLTTPYDVYLTLKEILDENNTDIARGCPKCKSLFKEQNWDRSCKEAAIDEHWCMCPDFQEISVEEAKIKQVGNFFYNVILNRTEQLINNEKDKKPVCAKWELSRIFKAHKNVPSVRHGANVPNKTKSDESDIFVIILELNPDLALFEATIKVHKQGLHDRYEVLGFISRLDSYYSHSKCVKTPLLKFYCHCV